MRSDGTHAHALTHGPRDAIHPAISPDGERITFVRHHDGVREIYLMRADGTHQQQLTQTRTDDPVFSPNGRWIAYTQIIHPYTSTKIYKMRIDSSHQRALVNGAQQPDWGPASRFS